MCPQVIQLLFQIQSVEPLDLFNEMSAALLLYFNKRLIYPLW